MNVINKEIFSAPSCKFKFLAKEGFNIPNFYEVTSTDEVIALYKDYMKGTRDSLTYDIDGLVEEINDYDIQSELGYEPNGLNPKFATAIKFDSIAAKTKLLNIRWTVGMTGKIIPTGIFEPVDIMGVTIQKASMHNYDYLMNYINKENLKIGSEVIIARKGDVIPQMIGVKSTDDNTMEIKIPTNCPVCDTKLNHVSVDLVCENPTCGAKTKGIFTNFFDTLKIKGLSEKFIDKAIEMYDIKTIDDLLKLSVSDIEKLDGFAKKSAEKAYNAIHSVKEVSPEQFMALLNIPNQGVRVFENLLGSTPIEKLLDPDFKPEDILDTKGIAEKTAIAIHEGIQANLDRIRENAEHFTIIVKKSIIDHSTAIAGKSFCITGKLNKGTRKDYENKIKSLGGTIAGVSAKLTYLVTNDTDTSSSKMKKANDLNVKWHNNGEDKKIIIINEEDLIELMEKING